MVDDTRRLTDARLEAGLRRGLDPVMTTATVPAPRYAGTTPGRVDAHRRRVFGAVIVAMVLSATTGLAATATVVTGSSNPQVWGYRIGWAADHCRVELTPGRSGMSGCLRAFTEPGTVGGAAVPAPAQPPGAAGGNSAQPAGAGIPNPHPSPVAPAGATPGPLPPAPAAGPEAPRATATPPGNSGAAPGHASTPPAQADKSPKPTPPGQGGTPPGQSSPKPKKP
jgi:hypothetical protein